MREQIVAAIAATLTGTPAGSSVFRSRAIPITRELSPAIVVTPVSESTEAQIGSRSDRRLQVRVEVIARGAVPDSVADATCVSAHSKILADTRLGGLCFDIEETASEWEIEDADLDAVSVATTYTVVYRTQLKNIDQAG
ncbi:MAG: hypothetical protein ACREXU_16840 [Gammaproteobacteria bacterium]